MNDFRNRPNDSYIQEADWQKLYILTEHWKSDLLFYTDDLRFLHHLIDKYFVWITKKENIDTVKEMQVSLVEVEKLCNSLLTRVNKHLIHLAELIDDPFKYDSHQFRTEHGQLEDDIVIFVQKFRNNRNKVFKITENILESEEFVRKLSFK